MLQHTIRMPLDDTEYLALLKDRAKESHVYKKFQLIGLEVAQFLEDEAHKSLYIKLAKTHGIRILRLAKDVAERKNVANKGAYFMKLLTLVGKQPHGKRSNNRK